LSDTNFVAPNGGVGSKSLNNHPYKKKSKGSQNFSKKPLF
jgi:hypothetical protein